MSEGHERSVRARVAIGAAAAALATAIGASGAVGAGGDLARAGECPGTFEVLHNDSIGKLKIPHGNYTISVKRISCGSAEDNFKKFLQDPDNNLPNDWRVLVKRKKFVNRSENVAFLIDRAPKS